jgi:hypothetical protein
MSEKFASPESSFGIKHGQFLAKATERARTETGAGLMAATGGILSGIFLNTLGILNPLFLGVGAAAGAFGGYNFFKAGGHLDKN